LQTALKKYSVDENNCSQKKDVLLLSSESAQIHPESKLSGFVSIGSQSIIGAGCNLSNVIIGENVCVPEGTQAENTILI
jgi:NDP-sugar pyrophosphorylase family protein